MADMGQKEKVMKVMAMYLTISFISSIYLTPSKSSDIHRLMLLKRTDSEEAKTGVQFLCSLCFNLV